MTAASGPAPLPMRRRRLPRVPLSAGTVGGAILLLIAGACFLSLPWSITRYAQPDYFGASDEIPPRPPSVDEPWGTDRGGRPLLSRCLLGGVVSLTIGLSAAGLAVAIGVAWGAIAGYAGGRIDAAMMRSVDVMYGLPYILLVVLVDLALRPLALTAASAVTRADAAPAVAGAITLLIAIGSVSWLTMARVIRGQVLSLKSQPFVEAARAVGASPVRVVRSHLLPNLVGPIVVYTTLTVPLAILQESFLSFLGIGVQEALPTWGNLAADGVEELATATPDAWLEHWWMLIFPCGLLGMTLMALNFLGDALRDRLDPRTK